MKDHTRCERIRICLAEGGLDPDRMLCSEEHVCVVAAGLGHEGMTAEQVDAITDQAINITEGYVPSPPEPPGMEAEVRGKWDGDPGPTR